MNTYNSSSEFLHRSKKPIEKQCGAACPAEVRFLLIKGGMVYVNYHMLEIHMLAVELAR